MGRTRPNTVCLLSNQGVATVVMKNLQGGKPQQWQSSWPHGQASISSPNEASIEKHALTPCSLLRAHLLAPPRRNGLGLTASGSHNVPQAVDRWVVKMGREAHWLPLVPGPALAIESVKGRSWRRLRLNSSENSPPQMLCPPVPSPVCPS